MIAMINMTMEYHEIVCYFLYLFSNIVSTHVIILEGHNKKNIEERK